MKILLFLFLIVPSICFADITTGLKAWWTLDQSGTLTDSSGNGNSLSTTGTTQVAGLNLNARSFPGTQSHHLDSTDLFYSDSYSLSAWIKPTTADANGRGIITKRSTAGASSEYVLVYFNNQFQFISWQNDSTTCVAITAAYTVNTNTWYHVVGVQRGNGNRADLYVNGVSIGNATQSAAMANTTTTIRLGTTTNSTDARTMAGVIDDVRIYNRALTDADVLQLYNSTNHVGSLLMTDV